MFTKYQSKWKWANGIIDVLSIHAPSLKLTYSLWKLMVGSWKKTISFLGPSLFSGANSLLVSGTVKCCWWLRNQAKHLKIETRWAPTSRVITPTYRGYNPSYPFIRPFIGVKTAFLTIVGAHLVPDHISSTGPPNLHNKIREKKPPGAQQEFWTLTWVWGK